MEIKPLISPDLKLMDERLFRPEPMGLNADLQSKSPLNIPERLRKEE